MEFSPIDLCCRSSRSHDSPDRPRLTLLLTASYGLILSRQRATAMQRNETTRCCRIAAGRKRSRYSLQELIRASRHGSRIRPVRILKKSHSTRGKAYYTDSFRILRPHNLLAGSSAIRVAKAQVRMDFPEEDPCQPSTQPWRSLAHSR